MNHNEFAEKIKAKYPEYADMDNRELAERIVVKHPEYREQVSFEIPTAPPGPMEQVARQAAGAALTPFAIPQGGEQVQPLQPQGSNPLMMAIDAAKQTFQNPQRIAPTMQQPSKIAGKTVEENVGGTLGKAAGFVTEMALDPTNYVMGPAGKAVGGVADDAAKVVGEKVLAPAGELASAVRTKDIARLFKNPMEVLTANLKKSGSKMGDLEKTVFGVTDDEARLIADAGSRTPGVARTIVRGLIDEGKQRAVAAGKDPSEWADALTPGELIAARRGASKLTTAAQGREIAINVKDLKQIEQTFVRKGKDKALEYLSAVRENSMAQTREAFLQLFPRNQNRSTNALRGFGSLGTAFLAGPMAALGAAVTQAPLTTGVATLAAKGIYEGGKKAAKVAIPTGLAAIKTFLQNR